MKAVVAILLVLGSTSVRAQKITGAEIVEYGILKKIVEFEGPLDVPHVLSGKVDNVIASPLIQSTATIKAVLGTTFGISVKLLGEPNGAIVSSHFRCIHPKLTDSASGRSSKTDDWRSPIPIGTPRYVSRTFDHQWELVPGEWTIQVLSDGKVVTEKTFDVVAP